QQLVYVENGDAAYLIYCPSTSALAGYDAFYILNLVEMENLLAGALSDDVTYVAFLDGEGRVVAESGQAESEQDVDGSVSRGFTVRNPFTFTAQISNSSMLAQFNTVLQRTFYTLIGLGGVAVLLVLLAMRSTYMP